MSAPKRNVDSGRRDSLGRRIMVSSNANAANRSDAPTPIVDNRPTIDEAHTWDHRARFAGRNEAEAIAAAAALVPDEERVTAESNGTLVVRAWNDRDDLLAELERRGAVVEATTPFVQGVRILALPDDNGRYGAPEPIDPQQAVAQIAEFEEKIAANKRAYRQIKIDDHPDYRSFMDAQNKVSEARRALSNERSKLIKEASHTPEFAETWHRHNVQDVSDLRNRLQTTKIGTLSAEQLREYLADANRFRDVGERFEESQSVYRSSLGHDDHRAYWDNPSYAWSRDDHGHLDMYREAESYQHAAHYANAALNTTNREHRDRFEQAAKRCALGRYDDGEGMPCMQCGHTMTSYDDHSFSCADCSR